MFTVLFIFSVLAVFEINFSLDLLTFSRYNSKL